MVAPALIGLGVGAGFGLLDYMNKKEQEKDDRRIAVATAAGSGFTGMRPSAVHSPSIWGTVGKGAATGAMVGSLFKGGEAVAEPEQFQDIPAEGPITGPPQASAYNSMAAHGGPTMNAAADYQGTMGGPYMAGPGSSGYSQMDAMGNPVIPQDPNWMPNMPSGGFDGPMTYPSGERVPYGSNELGFTPVPPQANMGPPASTQWGPNDARHQPFPGTASQMPEQSVYDYYQMGGPYHTGAGSLSPYPGESGYRYGGY